MLTMSGVGTSIEYSMMSKERMESIKSKSNCVVSSKMSPSNALPDCFVIFSFDVVSTEGILHFLTRFSLHGNTKKLLATTGNPSGSPLRHLDGIRTISISWIILGHTYFYTDIIHYQHYRQLKQLYQVDDNPLLMWLSNFTFSVDTFFHVRYVLIAWRGASREWIDYFRQFNKLSRDMNDRMIERPEVQAAVLTVLLLLFLS